MEEELIFIHNLVTRFNFECSVIALLALWDIVNLKQKDCTSNICESKRGGTIIPSMVLWTSQNVDLITFKCKRNDLFTIVVYQYWRYMIPRAIMTSCSRNHCCNSKIKVWVASMQQFFTIVVVLLKSFSWTFIQNPSTWFRMWIAKTFPPILKLRKVWGSTKYEHH
jgi:hypothetical protein